MITIEEISNSILRTLGWRQLAYRFLDPINPVPNSYYRILDCINQYNQIPNEKMGLSLHAHSFVQDALRVIEYRDRLSDFSSLESQWIEKWNKNN